MSLTYVAILANQKLFSAITNCESDKTCDTTLPEIPANSASVQSILQIVFGIIGATALIFVIVGGIQFVTSQGDPQSANKARSTVLYAIIGLVVALAAEAVVTFALETI